MPNSFYNQSGYPAYGADGDSQSARSEFAAIQAGFDKMPALTASALYMVRVNAAATALESVQLTATLVGSTATGNISATTVQGALADIGARQIDGLTWSAGGGNLLVLAPATHAATSKATPVDADEIPLSDSAATFGLKKLTWANLKAGMFSAWGALIAAGTSKATPVDADTMAISDSAAGNATKTLTWANLKSGVFAALGGLIAAATSKATPVDADGIALSDSAASNATKLLTWANLKATLKSYFDSIYIPAGAAGGVRQTVQQGVTNSSGYANMLSAGTGLALNLAAAAKAMRVAFAAGPLDYISTLSADVTGVVSSLAANNLSYITADYVSATSVAWDKTLAPPQYGYAYPRANQALLHFDGTAGATTMLDDYGNTWTAMGGAKLQTNQIKFGSAALGGGGALNVFNGTTDYIKTTDIVTMGNGSWTARAWAYPTTVAATQLIFNFAQGGGFGVGLGIDATAKTKLYLSSTGSSYNIANGTLGTATISANAWALFEITYDAVAGKYFVNVNGVADQTITSASKICAITQVNIGAQTNSTTFFNGYIDEFEFLPYCDHPNGTTYTPPVAASSVATAGYSSDFFSIPDMTMYKVTAASASAGANPTLT
ncbi:MAG TPA: LamG-like jellyroll fold domain-containing protein, partial [Candidatus Paceibacterota bacterium]